ncbi:MAG: hypothetical protein OXM55_00420 [Bdellovibrionales bacterium]|nr:hypothetical protein [Bdellovibrionales bacterium]
MKVLTHICLLLSIFSILFNHSTQAITSQQLIGQKTEQETKGLAPTLAKTLAEKEQVFVRIDKPNIGQGSGFFLGNSETLVISTYMLDVFTILLDFIGSIESARTSPRGTLSEVYIKSVETSFTLSHVSPIIQDVRKFLTASHLETITLIHEGNILNLEITDIALSIKDNIAVLKVKGYKGPYLQIAKSPVHKDSELYVVGFQSEDLTVINGKNIPQKQRPRQITIAGDQLTLNSINGSPVLNKNGKVVGVVTENFSNFIFANKVGHLTPLYEESSFREVSVDELKTRVTTEIKQLYKSAKEGDLWAMYMIGMGLKYKAENTRHDEIRAHQIYRSSSFWFQRAADHNLSPAQLQLGLLLYFGLGLPVDKKKAALLFQKAAQDSTIAQFLSGLMQHNSADLPENKKNVLFLIKKAAEQGFLLAQLLLLEIFMSDKKDPKSTEKAAFWLREAKKQNVTLATFGEKAIPDIISQSRLLFSPSRCSGGFE